MFFLATPISPLYFFLFNNMLFSLWQIDAYKGQYWKMALGNKIEFS
jgi:hypothetical protein